ncbi:MAG: hypothetical protein DRO14_03675 [Thermoprotei archaeon]|nr:MAG: hypothetical protein DRO14_03675 [Thermoprotei archaeon]
MRLREVLKRDMNSNSSPRRFLTIIVDGEDILGAVILDQYFRPKAYWPPDFISILPAEVLNSCSLLKDSNDYLILSIRDRKFIVIRIDDPSILILEIRATLHSEGIVKELYKIIVDIKKRYM